MRFHQRARRIDRDQSAFVQYGHPIGKKFNLRQCVRREKQGGASFAQNLRLEELAEFRCSNCVEAARRLVEQYHSRLMEQRA